MQREILKSPLNYTGNKYRIIPQISTFFPKKIGTFVDLFCGGATVGINVNADKIIFIDNNKRVISLLKFLSKCDFDTLLKNLLKKINYYNLSCSFKEKYSYFFKTCPPKNKNNGLKEFNKEGFSKLKADYNAIKNKNSNCANILLYLLLIYGFNNDLRFNSNGHYNLPCGKTDLNKNNVDKLKKFIEKSHKSNFEFICGDFKDKKIQNIILKSDFLYADPPYLITDAVYNESNKWNIVDEEKLLSFLSTCKKNGLPFILSNMISKNNNNVINLPLSKFLENNSDMVKFPIEYDYKSASYNKKNRYGNEKEVIIISNNDNMLKINNRRYIGCKQKLVDYIFETVTKLGYDTSNVFADLFGGTGIVAQTFALNGYKTIVNDTLYSNIVAYNAWLGKGEFSRSKINKYLSLFNSISADEIKNNYFSEIYGNKYFSVNDAKKIGYIRDYIEEHRANFTDKEYFILLSSLMYSADKIANTVGHYESYLKETPIDKGINLQNLFINDLEHFSDIYQMDANELVRKVKFDIAYIDPPYNARQYVNFYHVLENLAKWNKPVEFEGNSMKFKRNELKSDYCRANKALKLFEDLVNNINCKLIIVSYNNTYEAKSASSINTIKQEDIKKILSRKGNLTIKEIDYKYFDTGKTNLKNHKEFLYICEVGKWQY